jgi:HD-like signal output (HDOD) protein
MTIIDTTKRHEALQSRVKNISILPTIPVVAQDVLTMTDDDTVSLSSLVSVVEKDPAISLRIISVANSAFFGFGVPAESLMEAVSRIGFDQVKNLALGVSLMTLFNDGKNKDALSYEKIFSHSISVGLTAKFLLKKLNLSLEDSKKIESDVLLMNGILHDMGYLILNKYFPSEFNQVITHVSNGTPVLSAEEMVFEFNHCDMGSWLANKWNLPESVVLTTLHHHFPSELQNSVSYAAIIHLADYLVDSCGRKVIQNNIEYRFDPACYDMFNMKKGDIHEFIDSINEEGIIHDL